MEFFHFTFIKKSVLVYMPFRSVTMPTVREHSGSVDFDQHRNHQHITAYSQTNW